jgi:hypothetical protein
VQNGVPLVREEERQPHQRVNSEQRGNSQREQAAAQPASGEHDRDGGRAVDDEREDVERRSALSESRVQRTELKRGAIAGEQEIRHAALHELPYRWNEGHERHHAQERARDSPPEGGRHVSGAHNTRLAHGSGCGPA